jgi:hypothetical protein
MAHEHPCLTRPRAGGRFTADPAEPPKKSKSSKPSGVRTLDNLRRLRRAAMQLTEVIERMMTPPKPGRAADRAKPRLPNLPADYARVIGPSAGAVDGLNVLTEVVIRIIDKEREIGGPLDADIQRDHRPVAGSLDRRIFDELDRIAARKRA